jgi:hypothetical protein
MRTYILFFTLHLSSILYCQDIKIVTEKALFIDFDTTMGYVHMIPNRSISKPNMLYRFHHRNSERIKCEYVKVEKDTFLYVEYDSINLHHIRKQGNIYLSDDCRRQDTTTCYQNDDINQPYISVTLGCTALKHGFWEEYQDSFILSGHYQNDRKQGVWKKDALGKLDVVYHTYRNDTIINVKQFDVLKTNDIDSIKFFISGRYAKSYNNFRQLKGSEDDTFNDVFTFHKNGSISVERHYLGYLLKEEKGRWEISPQYLTLILENGKVEKYKLSIVSEYGIVFEK